MDDFWENVGKPEPSGCWIWMGKRPIGEYGLYRTTEGVWRVAHRVSYELLVGLIPDGLEIDHLCYNRGCVNPDHLEPVTHSENMLRAYARKGPKQFCIRGHRMDSENVYLIGGDPKKRICKACRRLRERQRRASIRPEGWKPTRKEQRGSAHPLAKFTEDQIPGIRSDPRPLRQIADEYGVTPQAIYWIKKGRTWTHVG